MLKIATICGTRPEIIRLSETIKKLDMYTSHCLIFTGQNFDYEMSQIFFDELGIREPDYKLNVQSNSVGKLVANVLSRCEEVLVKEKPDVVLVLGDTNSALSSYIAKRLGVRVVHMEAGNRCWDKRVPEEINRKLIDHIADVNLCYTEHARRNLLREGMHPSGIFVIGSPLPEVYDVHRDKIIGSGVRNRLGLSDGRYLLASIHREENTSDLGKLSTVMHALDALGEHYKVPVVFSVHPRTASRLPDLSTKMDNILLSSPFGMIDYVNLQLGALCCLSDSGTIHEDAAILGIPAVNVRTSNERPEVYDAGNVVQSSTSLEGIMSAVSLVTQQHSRHVAFNRPTEYLDTNYSDKAVRIILSSQLESYR